MLKIGFANKYYTLWDVTTEPVYSEANGQHFQTGTKTNFYYQQNLSISMKKAQAKAQKMGCKDLTPDDSLRGKSRTFSTYKANEDIFTEDQFKFGRHQALQIIDCKDVGYLVWYFGETNSQVAAEHIVSLDPSYKYVDGELLSKKDQLLREGRKAIESGEVLLTASSNFQYSEEHDHASLRVSFDPETEALETLAAMPYNKWGVTIQLHDVSEQFMLCKRSYQGNDYYVPEGKRSFKGTQFRLVDGKIQIEA